MAHIGATVPVDEAKVTGLWLAGDLCAAGGEDPVVQSSYAAILRDGFGLAGDDRTVTYEIRAPFFGVAQFAAGATFLCKGDGDHICGTVAGEGIVRAEA